MANLKNINFMSEERFNSLDTTSENDLYAVEAGTLTVQTGTVISFAGNSSLDGFIICNGAAISRETYSNLFAAIGTTYGSGDGSTTFNVPNLTDKFIQGSGTAGSVKNAGLPNITGKVTYITADAPLANEGQYPTRGAFRWNNQNTITKTSVISGDGSRDLDFDASRVNSIYGNSSTVQPPALTMRYYIKY